MGIPYSKQINAAFDEVTPLVAAGFEVLQTTKNIAVLLLAIQIVTVILLAMMFMMLAALLVTVNPDLKAERQAIVTPVVKWFAHLFLGVQNHSQSMMFAGLIVLLGIAIGAVAGVYLTSRDFQRIAAEETASGDGESDQGKQLEGDEG